MVGSSGVGDMEHVSWHKLCRSDGETCKTSQQSMEGLTIGCPGAVQRDGAETAWLRPRGFQCHWDGTVICSPWVPRWIPL